MTVKSKKPQHAADEGKARKKGDKRELLLSAAERIFGSRGYHAATIDDIVKEAGVGKGTFYRCFPGKKDIFLAIFEQTIALLRQNLAVSMTGETDVFRRLDRAIGTALDFFQQHRGFFSIVLHAETAAGEDGGFRERIDAGFQLLQDDIGRTLERGIGQGMINPVDTLTWSVGMFNLVNGTLTWWLGRGEGVSRDRVHDMLARFCAFGLASPELRDEKAAETVREISGSALDRLAEAKKKLSCLDWTAFGEGLDELEADLTRLRMMAGE